MTKRKILGILIIKKVKKVIDTKKIEKLYFFTGITGQLGQALCRYLFNKYNNIGIIGITRNINGPKCKLFNKYNHMVLIQVDKGDQAYLQSLISFYRPDVIGNLSAQSSVAQSLIDPIKTIEDNTYTALSLLECIKNTQNYSPIYFQIGSTEIYKKENLPIFSEINEESEKCPVNPYGLSKLISSNIIDFYNSAHNIKCIEFICSHFISEFQDQRFVVGKIIDYICNFKNQTEKLKLGNIDISKDWTYVDDVCSAIDISLSILSNNYLSTKFNIASYNIATIENIIKLAFETINIKDYKNYIETDPTLYRPNDDKYVFRISSEKLRKLTSWTPRYNLQQAVQKIIKEKSNE